MEHSAQHHKTSEDNESGVRVFFGFLSLLIIPLGLAILVMAVKYQGLTSPVAWDSAQLARNIAAGKGFVTDVVRPFSLAVVPKISRHPDLYNMPLQPLSLAFAFRFTTPADRVVALVGMGFWVLTVWLTCLVAYRWFSGKVALLAVLFYVCNPALLAMAVSGLPLQLLTLVVLSACWAAVPGRRKPVTTPAAPVEFAQLSVSRIMLTGAVCALAMLTEFALGTLVLAMLWYMVATQRLRWRAVGCLLGGFVLVMAPWWLRNLLSSQFSSFGLQWYNLLANTRSFPGESIWQTCTPPADPLLHALGHPRDMLVKFLASSNRFLQSAPTLLHPLMALFFLASLPGLLRNAQRRGLVVLILLGIGLSAGASCLLEPEPQLLVIWAPLVSILVAARLQNWITEHIGSLSWHWLLLRPAPPKSPKTDSHRYQNDLMRVFTTKQAGRAAVYLLILVAAAYPLGGYFFRARAGADPNFKKRFEPLQSRVPKNAVIWTDQPALVAWYTERPTIWLPQHETDLERIETAGGRPAAIYVTPSASLMPDSMVGDWWKWVSSPHGIYRGLVPVAGGPGDMTLRLRPAETNASSPAMELERLQLETSKNLQSSDAHYRLAVEYYRLDRLREATLEFRAASQLDPQNTQALLGLWQTQSHLNDYSGSFALAERVAELDPRAPASAAVLDEATRFFEHAALRAHDPWLLLEAALCHAKRQRWDQAEAWCRRVATAAPQELPLRLLLGDLYMQKGLPEQALTEFRQLVEEQPVNAVARQALGIALQETGQLPDALEMFTKAAKLRPDWPLPYFMAGNVHMQLKSYSSAADDFAKALELAPHSPRFQFALGTACVLLNDQNRAATVYEAILADYPNDPVAMNNLAVAYAKTGQKLDRALTLIRKLATAFPKNLEIQDSLGLVCTSARLHDEAITVLRETIRLAPNRALAHYHLAKALLAKGQCDEATSELRLALAHDLPALEKADAGALLSKP